MGYEDVNVTGKSSLSPQEVDNRRKEFAKLKEEGHTIELTARGKNSGVSYDYWDRLKKDVDAGIFEDRTEEGLTKNDKLGLAKEFESVFLDHGYIKSKDDFLKMKASNKKGGRSYEITYDEYIKLANAAGFYLVEKPEEPAKPKEAKAPDNKPEPAAEDKKAVPTPEVPTPKPVEEPKNEELDTVILDSTTYTDENGNVIADDTKALVNGQPYHSKTGFNTFGTLDPEHIDWRQYSRSELDKMESAPTGKKTTTEPDSVPTAPAGDKGSVAAPQITVPEIPVVENEPVMPAQKTEVKAQPPVEAKNDKTPTPVAVNEPVTPAPKTEAPVTTEVKAQPPVEAKNDEAPTPVAVNEPVTPAPKTEAPAVASEPKTAKEKFEADLAADSELASADVKQRPAILDQRISGMERQIADLKRTTSKTTGALFWKKTVTTNGAEVNKDRIAGLERDLDSAQRDKIYADAVAGNITGFGSTSLVDENGNTVASYPQYSTVKYKDANGQESYVAKVMEYNTTTHKTETKYYSFDVQKVNDLKGLPERWQAVPDMKNQLTDGQEVR